MTTHPRNMLIKLLVLLNMIASIRSSTTSQECAQFLAPSTIPGAGRGIIAGKSFEIGDLVHHGGNVIVFLANHSAECQLNNYAFSSGFDDYLLIMFGSGVLYNHMDPKNLNFFWSRDTNSPNPNGLPFSSFTEIHFEVISSVLAGQELFSNYGNDWFSPKRIEEKSVEPITIKQITTEELHQYGHCLSYVGSDLSRVPWAGRGLFARKAFVAGEVVTVSPVLVLERNLVEQTRDSSLLINYCYSHPSTDAVFLPLGVAALINGNYSSDNKSNSANVEVGWYDWSQLLTPDTPGHIADSLRALNLTEKLETDLQELYEAPFAQVDFQFVATRDIAEGEEILADYGEQWRNTWSEYIDLLNQPVVNGDAGTCDMAENQRSTNIRYQASKWQILMQNVVEQFRNSAAPSSLPADFPQFRQFITLPETIIPQKWKN